MKLKAKQKNINGDVWYVWNGDKKIATIKRTNNSQGGQQTFVIEGTKTKHSSIDKCLEFLTTKSQ